MCVRLCVWSVCISTPHHQSVGWHTVQTRHHHIAEAERGGCIAGLDRAPQEKAGALVQAQHVVGEQQACKLCYEERVALPLLSGLFGRVI
jgi:hypothetical protein